MGNDLDRLIDLLAKGPQDKTAGICYNAEVETENYRNMVEEWEHYSGSVDYPVPHPKREIDPFVMYEYTENLWEGEYGRLRIELLKHWIKWIMLHEVKQRMVE